MGKSTISMAIFNSYVKLPEGITRWCPRSIAKLVQITPISLWFLLVIYLNGIINQLITWGAPPCSKEGKYQATTMVLYKTNGYNNKNGYYNNGYYKYWLS